MNFFERQDRARSHTTYLVSLLLLGVALTILAGYFTVRACLALTEGSTRTHFGRSDGFSLAGQHFFENVARWHHDPAFLIVAVATVAIILFGSLMKIFELGSGGKAVPMSLGALPIDPSTKDPAERRLLNVIEEMAIASGCPMPGVYLLGQENGINAFAAGMSTSDATITVTRGCLDQLTRDELQGVIGHEFSHILNGDMTLNMRLIGILAGILVIGKIGMGILRNIGRGRSSSREDRNDVVILIFGVAITLIGYFGFFCGRLIKAAVSRERERLADASSIQFTRNPLGLGGALLKIRATEQGSLVLNKHAEDVSHMFFCDGLGGALFSLLETHPPIEERLAAIDPGLLNETARLKPVAPPAPGAPPRVPTPAKAVAPGDELEALSPETMAGFAAAAPVIRTAAKAVASSVGTVTPAHVMYAQTLLGQLPAALRAAGQTADGARGLMYALFLEPLKSPGQSIRDRQLGYLRERELPSTLATMDAAHRAIADLGDRVRYPLLTIAAPALQTLPVESVKKFLENVDFLVKADGRVDLFEFSMQTLLTRRLVPSATRPGVVRFRSADDISMDLCLVLSTLAYAGCNSPSAADPAFRKGWPRLGCKASVQLAMPKDCTPRALNGALANIAVAAPSVKESFVAAATDCVLADGQVTVRESEMLRAIVETIDVPMPPLLPASS